MKTKKQTRSYKSCIWFHSPDNCLWPLWKGGKPQRRKKIPEHSGAVSTHISYFRGPTLSDWFRNTETLDEVSDLLDLCVDVGFRDGYRYSKEAIERMVRDRVNHFRRAGEILPKQKIRDLQDWREWFTEILTGKEKPAKINTENFEPKPDFCMPLTIKQWQSVFGMTKKEFLAIRKDKDSIYHFKPVSKKSHRLVLPIQEIPAGFLKKYHEGVAENIEAAKR